MTEIDKRLLKTEYLSRLEDACQASGKAGLRAMLKREAPNNELYVFWGKEINNWLQRELCAYQPEVSQKSARFDIACVNNKGKRIRLQMRFAAPYSRWLLLVWKNGRWNPLVPARKCLSITDWLGEVRHIATGWAGGKKKCGALPPKKQEE